jgi:hypothetical protein
MRVFIDGDFSYSSIDLSTFDIGTINMLVYEEYATKVPELLNSADYAALALAASSELAPKAYISEGGSIPVQTLSGNGNNFNCVARYVPSASDRVTAFWYSIGIGGAAYRFWAKQEAPGYSAFTAGGSLSPSLPATASTGETLAYIDLPQDEAVAQQKNVAYFSSVDSSSIAYVSYNQGATFGFLSGSQPLARFQAAETPITGEDRVIVTTIEPTTLGRVQTFPSVQTNQPRLYTSTIPLDTSSTHSSCVTKTKIIYVSNNQAFVYNKADVMTANFATPVLIVPIPYYVNRMWWSEKNQLIYFIGKPGTDAGTYTTLDIYVTSETFDTIDELVVGMPFLQGSNKQVMRIPGSDSYLFAGAFGDQAFSTVTNSLQDTNNFIKGNPFQFNQPYYISGLYSPSYLTEQGIVTLRTNDPGVLNSWTNATFEYLRLIFV